MVTVHVSNAVEFDSSLNVDGAVHLIIHLDVDGITTFNDTT